MTGGETTVVEDGDGGSVFADVVVDAVPAVVVGCDISVLSLVVTDTLWFPVRVTRIAATSVSAAAIPAAPTSR